MRCPFQVSLENSKFDGLERTLALAGLSPKQLMGSWTIFESMSGRGHSFEAAGRSMLWWLLNFPKLAKVTAVPDILQAGVFGRRIPLTAMHRGLTPKRRPLFPLPLKDGKPGGIL